MRSPDRAPWETDFRLRNEWSRMAATRSAGISSAKTLRLIGWKPVLPPLTPEPDMPTPIWINDGQHDLDLARFVLEDDDFVNLIVSQAPDELHRFTPHRSFAAAVDAGRSETLRAIVSA